MTRVLKAHGFKALELMGLNAAVGQSTWRLKRLLILCFHGVAIEDEHVWNPTLFISPAQLEQRLTLLVRQRCSVIGLDEGVRALRDGTLPDRAVCLTFDDGYFDFARVVYPRLRAYRFPATVYLNTLRCQQNLPNSFLALSYVLWKSGRTELEGNGLPGLEARRYASAKPAEREAVVAMLLAGMRTARLNMQAKDAVLREVARRVGVDHEALASNRLLNLMSPSEVAALAREGVAFELHTHTHTTPAEPEPFLNEIRQNRARIEAMTGRSPSHFCYPSGVYRRSYFDLLQREGVVSATTTEPGLATRDTPPFLLPRFVDTSLVSDAEFQAWLTGLAPLVLHMKHARRIGRSPSAEMAGPPAQAAAYPARARAR